MTLSALHWAAIRPAALGKEHRILCPQVPFRYRSPTRLGRFSRRPSRILIRASESSKEGVTSEIRHLNKETVVSRSLLVHMMHKVVVGGSMPKRNRPLNQILIILIIDNKINY